MVSTSSFGYDRSSIFPGPEATFDPFVRSTEELNALLDKRAFNKSKIDVDNFKQSMDQARKATGKAKQAVDNLKAATRNLAVDAATELKDKLGGAFENLAISAASVLASGFVDAMAEIGTGLRDGADAAMVMGAAFENLGAKILAALPNLLLNAGLAVMQIPDPSGAALGIGLALVAASGLIALVNARWGPGGETGTSSASISEAVSDNSQFIREGASSRGDTVTVINGNVFVKDELDGTIAATSAGMAGNR